MMRVRNIGMAAMLLGASGALMPLALTSRAEAVSPATLRAIWPQVVAAPGFSSAAAAAQSFATQRLGMPTSLLVTTRVDAHDAVVGLRTAARGPVTNVRVEYFGAAHWRVISCTTADIELRTPVALSTLASPQAVSGRSLAFEGVVNIRLYVDGRSQPLVATTAMGGGTAMTSWRTTLHFHVASPTWGTMVVLAKSPKDGSTAYATARRVMVK